MDTFLSKLILPALGLGLVFIGAQLQPIDDFISTIVLGVGFVLLLGGLMIGAGSLKGFAILLTLLVVSVFFGIIVFALPERFGAWQFLLFPQDVGVHSIWPSVQALCLLVGVAALVLYLVGAFTKPTKPHGH